MLPFPMGLRRSQGIPGTPYLIREKFGDTKLSLLPSSTVVWSSLLDGASGNSGDTTLNPLLRSESTLIVPVAALPGSL